MIEPVNKLIAPLNHTAGLNRTMKLPPIMTLKQTMDMTWLKIKLIKYKITVKMPSFSFPTPEIFFNLFAITIPIILRI